MTSVLSEKAKNDLISSILSFLNEHNLVASAKLLQDESNVQPNPSHMGLLERKWVTVARLQKRCMDLERELELVKKEIDTNVFRKKKHFDFTPLPNNPCKYLIEGHKRSVLCCSVHPVYSVIATASDDASIKLFDYETGEFERTLSGHVKSVNFVAFNSDGTLLASCSSDKTIKLWKVENEYTCYKTCYGHEDSISMIKFSSNNLLYSCSKDGTVREWNTIEGTCENIFYGHTQWTRCLDINESNALIASSGNDNYIKIWSVETKDELFELFGHDNAVEIVLFVPKISTKDVMQLTKSSQEFESLLSAGRDKTIKLWNLKTKSCIFNFLGHQNWIRSLCIQYADLLGDFEYPSCLLSTGDDSTIRVIYLFI